MSITPAQVAEWRRIIHEEGALHSALAQRIAPMLLEEIERAWAQLERIRRDDGAREATALRSRLGDATNREQAAPGRARRRRG